MRRRKPLIVQDIKPVEQKKFNLNDCVYRKVTPVSYVNPPRKFSRDELKIRNAVDEALELDAYMKKHDLVEEAKRRIAEEARRRAAEKAREEARLKAEEDACAVAEYYASLGYRVRLKTQASKMGELIFEPTNAAATLTEAVEALEGAITGGAEEEAAIADGLLMSDEEIAARMAAQQHFRPAARDRRIPASLRAYAKLVSSADKGAVRIVEEE